MTHFSPNVEYGLYVLAELATAPANDPSSAEDIAASVRLPVTLVRSLLAELERAGLVVKAEPAVEGWRLGDSPERISVLAVVRAVQAHRPLFENPELATASVLLALTPNARRRSYALHKVMLEAEHIMMEALARKTLRDIAS